MTKKRHVVRYFFGTKESLLLFSNTSMKFSQYRERMLHSHRASRSFRKYGNVSYKKGSVSRVFCLESYYKGPTFLVLGSHLGSQGHFILDYLL